MGRRGKRRKFGAPIRGGEFPEAGLCPAKDCNEREPVRACPDGRMREAAKMLEFEVAAALREQIIQLRGT